jgi:hypothetical protein
MKPIHKEVVIGMEFPSRELYHLMLFPVISRLAVSFTILQKFCVDTRRDMAFRLIVTADSGPSQLSAVFIA